MVVEETAATEVVVESSVVEGVVPVTVDEVVDGAVVDVEVEDSPAVSVDKTSDAHAATESANTTSRSSLTMTHLHRPSSHRWGLRYTRSGAHIGTYERAALDSGNDPTSRSLAAAF